MDPEIEVLKALENTLPKIFQDVTLAASGGWYRGTGLSQMAAYKIANRLARDGLVLKQTRVLGGYPSPSFGHIVPKRTRVFYRLTEAGESALADASA